MTGVRAIGFVLLLTVPAFARDPKLKLTWIQAAPGDFILAGKWASQRIVVTGKLPDGTLRDVTGQTRFKSSNSKVAAVTKSGLVTPVADGEANIELNANGKKQKLHVTVKDSRTQSAAFLTEVRPLLSKLGCNTAQCHGAARGKGGLRLSLFGGDAESDFEALTKAAGGRRINRADPRDSLLYLKATGDLGHPGAKAGSRESEILLTWLNAGAPWTNKENAQITDLKLYPDERQFQKGQTQRLLVTAIFSDGQVRDVTADAAYHTSNPKIASVSAEGEVRAEDTGDAAIVVTYQRKSTVLRLAIPQPGPKPFPKLAANNRIDELVYAKLKSLGIPPSGPRHRRGLPPPRLPGRHRHPAHRRTKRALSWPTRSRPSAPTDRPPARTATNLPISGRSNGATCCASRANTRSASGPRRSPSTTSWVHDSIAAQQALRPVRPRTADRQRQQLPRSARRISYRAMPSKDPQHASPKPPRWSSWARASAAPAATPIPRKAGRSMTTSAWPRSSPRSTTNPRWNGRKRSSITDFRANSAAPANARDRAAAGSLDRRRHQGGQGGRPARPIRRMAHRARQSVVRRSHRQPHLVLAAGARNRPRAGRPAAHQSAGESGTARLSRKRARRPPLTICATSTA